MIYKARTNEKKNNNPNNYVALFICEIDNIEKQLLSS